MKQKIKSYFLLTLGFITGVYRTVNMLLRFNKFTSYNLFYIINIVKNKCTIEKSKQFTYLEILDRKLEEKIVE